MLEPFKLSSVLKVHIARLDHRFILRTADSLPMQGQPDSGIPRANYLVALFTLSMFNLHWYHIVLGQAFKTFDFQWAA